MSKKSTMKFNKNFRDEDDQQIPSSSVKKCILRNSRRKYNQQFRNIDSNTILDDNWIDEF